MGREEGGERRRERGGGVELSSASLSVVNTGVVGTVRDGVVMGMHIGLLSSCRYTEQVETVIGTPLTIIVGLVCTHCCNIGSKSVLFMPSKLIILARNTTCPVLLSLPHMSLIPPMYSSERPHLQIFCTSLATSSAISLALSEVCVPTI